MELRQALIDNQVASAAEVDEALARQALYGGDVITNLLELVAIDEGLAQRTLAKAHQMQVAPSGELPYASAAAIELVPRDVATSLGVYPYRLEGGLLSVVASEPLSESAGVELGFALKVKLEGMLALAPRVKQAIARDYAFALDRRTQKAVLRLDRRAAADSNRAPNPLTEAPTLSELPRPTSVAPAAFPMAWSESLTPTDGQLLAETVEQPEVVLREQLAAQAAAVVGAEPPHTERSVPEQDPEKLSSERTGPASPAAPESVPIRRGPYTVAQAKKDLRSSTTPKQVLTVYFNFAAQYFDHAAAFTLKGDEARCRHTRGLSSEISDRRVQLSSSPALRRVRQSQQWVTTKLTEEDAQLAKTLGTDGLSQGVLLPVRVKERCVVILYGGFVSSDVELPDVGELLAFEALVALALSHVIRVRKTVAPGAVRPPSEAQSVPKYARPRIEDRAQAVAGVLASAAPEAVLAPATIAIERPPEPVIRQSGNTIPVRAPSVAQPDAASQDDAARVAASQLSNVTQPSASSPTIANETLPPVRPKSPVPLTTQPPGVFAEELDEARDSGWDFDL